MPSCIRKSLNQKHFWGKLGLLLVMPVIFISLVQCTTNVIESPKQSIKRTELPKQPLKQISPRWGDNYQASAHTLEEPSGTKAPLPIPTVWQNDPQVIGFQNTSNEQVCASNDTRIEIDISEQQLYLLCNREELKVYPISTAKNGINNRSGSGGTPLGRHRIKNKIGKGAPPKTIFKARRNTGRIARLNVPGAGDLVTTRIMWLKGLEPGVNSGSKIDSYRRYIYIHGTAEENKIGQPASHGCIRMYNRDVTELFDRVIEGTEVYIKR